MLQQIWRMIAHIRWSQRDVAQFVGQFLTEPPPHIVFDRPLRPLTAAIFTVRAKRDGVRLALKTQMLYRGRRIFINGECCEIQRADALLRLADQRFLPPRTPFGAEARNWLYRWYCCGYVELGCGPGSP